MFKRSLKRVIFVLFTLWQYLFSKIILKKLKESKPQLFAHKMSMCTPLTNMKAIVETSAGFKHLMPK